MNNESGDKSEKIKLAAVKTDDGIIFTGNNHSEIIMTIIEVNKMLETISQEKQGFVTNTHRFVNRREAAEIAFKAGQIDKPAEVLMSEDITGNFPWAKDEITCLSQRLKKLEDENKRLIDNANNTLLELGGNPPFADPVFSVCAMAIGLKVNNEKLRKQQEQNENKK